MQCFRRCLLGFLAIAGAAIAAAVAGAFFITGWLDNPDPPERADAIVVLADDPSRAFQAADLYLQGYAKQVYVTVPRPRRYAALLAAHGIALPRSEDLFRRVLLERGVPEAAIHTLGNNLVSTRAEAETVRAELAGSPKLLVVTSPYHIRRTRMIFTDALPGRELRFISSRYEPYPEPWWTDQDLARDVILELVKTVFYLTGGRF
ncbi:MAG: YdcF family protein [Burkholderiales bacterium]